MIQLFYFTFFLSGVSALIFESLWFQLMGLSLGSSTWALSIVLASFMGGISLGGGLIAFLGNKIKYPIRFYAFLEFVIGISGYLLVFLLPHLSKIFVPLFSHFLDQTVILNILRGTIAVLLMVIPTAAMGATLPALGKAACIRDSNFGKLLGMLYGWNTLGGVIGVCASEFIFIKWVGLNNTGIIAAGCNIVAAVVVFHFAREEREINVSSFSIQQRRNHSVSAQTKRLLAASCLSGFIFLALEVVWFRFLALFFISNTLNFSILLAVVLTGISMGGLCAGFGFRNKPDSYSLIVPVICLNGILITFLYDNFRWVFVGVSFLTQGRVTLVLLSSAFFLIFPIAFFSGVIFTMLARILRTQMESETKTIGFLTLVNALGSMGGSFVAALFFLPLLGIEKTFFLLALSYGIVLILLFEGNEFVRSKKRFILYGGLIGIYGVSLISFPFGLMDNFYSEFPLIRYRINEEKRVAIKEGMNETIQYLRKDLAGQPSYYRLVTNNYSMSATNPVARRYMSFFAYWPMVVRPGLHHALLICYGCGNTAKALTNILSIEHIDIVDTSEDIIKMSSVVYPDPKTNPIFNHRVKTYIEDGRFFLLSTNKTYDLITAEPPPPICKGAVNLYTQEYFQLIHDRLSQDGIATYWLPVNQLKPGEAKSIIRGFCNVFNNCSLWASSQNNWMLVGIKKLEKEISYDDFVRTWDDAVLGDRLRELGFVNPQQFGSLFIADGKRLRDWVCDSQPLIDNYPKILESRSPQETELNPQFQDFMHSSDSMNNFLASEQIARLWPQRIRQETEKYFASRNLMLKIVSRNFTLFSVKKRSDKMDIFPRELSL
jgi:spermidine synthase